MTDCSVADQCAFDALPDDVQAMARRVLMEALIPPTANAASAERSPLVGQCCIDAYLLGWDECADEYQAPSVGSDHDIAARIAESRDDDDAAS